MIKTKPVRASMPASKRSGPVGTMSPKPNGGERGVGEVEVVGNRALKVALERAESQRQLTPCTLRRKRLTSMECAISETMTP